MSCVNGEQPYGCPVSSLAEAPAETVGRLRSSCPGNRRCTISADFSPSSTRRIELTSSHGKLVDMSHLPLPQFYGESLAPLLPILDDSLSTTDLAVQATLSTGLDNLHLIGRMITSLGVFSENESADELGDGELRFMSLGWVIGECEGKQGLGGRDDRMNALKRSEVRPTSCFSAALIVLMIRLHSDNS